MDANTTKDIRVEISVEEVEDPEDERRMTSWKTVNTIWLCALALSSLGFLVSLVQSWTHVCALFGVMVIVSVVTLGGRTPPETSPSLSDLLDDDDDRTTIYGAS